MMYNNISKKDMQDSLEKTREMIAQQYAIANNFRVDKTLNNVYRLNPELGIAFRAAGCNASQVAKIYLSMCESTEKMIETLLDLDIFEDSDDKSESISDIDESPNIDTFDVGQFIDIIEQNAKLFENLALNLRHVCEPEEQYSRFVPLNNIRMIDEDLYNMVKVLIYKGYGKAIGILIETLEKLANGFKEIFEVFSLKDKNGADQ